MICLTVPQAADRVYATVITIGRWISDGELLAVCSPIDGHWYVEEEHLLSVARSHDKTGDAPTVRPGLVPIARLARWLTDHGKPITTSGVERWVERGHLKPAIPGRRGPGGSALYDPLTALSVYIARSDAPQSKLP